MFRHARKLNSGDDDYGCSERNQAKGARADRLVPEIAVDANNHTRGRSGTETEQNVSPMQCDIPLLAWGCDPDGSAVDLRRNCLHSR